MVKLRFFVHCNGWKDGGYPNTHYHNTEQEALEHIERSNAEWKARCEKLGEEVSGRLSIISIEPVTDEEFAEDYCGMY